MIHQSKIIAANNVLISTTYTLHFDSCDYCNYWFHGSGVGVSTEDASSIETYKCPTCLRECIEHPFYMKVQTALHE